ncbi:hypothetical protein [Amantichitinum ursilacus]|uniref:Uncharacterized protein n=1 Tax=Amantichitinum ursilacus TaxID=857265 RepID=A0A0N0XL25_9NEIS|nr:hypothetical protein [Amantichitinum ursilacus]KPC53734.1 hypothetical protein WG78_07820 [Amantichitinum ursilacus]
MWFILLFMLVGFAIPLAAEIHVKGRDNLLTRMGEQIVHSDAGERVRQTVGIGASWVYGAGLLLLGTAAVVLVLRVLGWVLRLVF